MDVRNWLVDFLINETGRFLVHLRKFEYSQSFIINKGAKITQACNYWLRHLGRISAVW